MNFLYDFPMTKLEVRVCAGINRWKDGLAQRGVFSRLWVTAKITKVHPLNYRQLWPFNA